MVEESEFGRGMAICLVKFAEHFENGMAQQIGNVRFFYDGLKGDMKKLEKHGADVQRDVKFFDRVYLAATGSVEKGLSHLMELWANGASDHLYNIEIPTRMMKSRLGKLVGKLQSKGLRMGHGFTGEIYTYADFRELQELTEKAALELDKNIGLKPDLGKW